jgi:diguanylate cyclase (GGDEF)-like protein/PAS domain S-box-containing protein
MISAKLPVKRAFWCLWSRHANVNREVTVARHSRPVDDASGRGVDAVARLDQELAEAHDRIDELQRELDQTRRLQTTAHRAQRVAEARSAAIWTSMPLGLALVNEFDEFTLVNESLCQVLGRPEDAILGRTSASFAVADDRRPTSRPHLRRHDDPVATQTEIRFARPDGTVRWAQVTTTHSPGPLGQEWTLLCVDDVTDRRLEREALRDSAANLAAVAEATRKIQAGDDTRTTIVAAVESMAGAASACLVEPLDDQTWVITTSTASTLDGTTLPRAAGGAIAQAFDQAAPLFLADPVGSVVVAPSDLAERIGSILWQPVVQGDASVGVIVLKWGFRIDELPAWSLDAIQLLADEAAVALSQEMTRAELRRLAGSDPLTGLPNRRAWDDQLAVLGETAAIRGTPLVVAMVDLDHFKRFNDRHGHTAGDQHLCEFARRARGALRDCDLLTRWGGEEFSIALPDCTTAQAHALLRQVQHAVPGDQTCSIGWSFWDRRESLDEVMLRVDQSLYEAKAAGRGRIMSTERERVRPK